MHLHLKIRQARMSQIERWVWCTRRHMRPRHCARGRRLVTTNMVGSHTLSPLALDSQVAHQLLASLYRLKTISFRLISQALTRKLLNGGPSRLSSSSLEGMQNRWNGSWQGLWIKSCVLLGTTRRIYQASLVLNFVLILSR